jgi:hypothetical protein
VTNVGPVGSGLILLVIVGAWLAVLVPMALRSHDAHQPQRSADRFNDAMRVLRRRGVPVAADSAVLMPARPAEAPAPPVVRPGPTLVERRRRVTLLLAGLTLGTLVAGLLGSSSLLLVAAAGAVLTVGYVAHCRKQAQLAARRRRRAAARARRAADRARPVIAGVPARMPARPAPVPVPVAARYDEPVPVPAAEVAVAVGGTWSPVPVPLPTYVGKDVAPPRATRVLDLTRPGEWSAALEADDSVLADLGDGRDLEDILERRRAVGGW